jgi:NADH:ubiquinone oxidoreductase subunit 3 (subunit A)
MEMTKFEKKLCVFAIIFVAIYIGAMVIKVRSRVSNPEKITRIESVNPGEGEGQMMLAQLFLPMAIFFTVTVCFIIVKNKRSKAILDLEESDEDYP